MTSNKKLIQWVEQMTAFCVPKRVVWCTGTKEEYDELTADMVRSGTLIQLNPERRPNSFYCRTNSEDVARLEYRTFICSKREEDAGPTNNWKDPVAMKTILQGLFAGCMKGRTMYVIPFCMGTLGSPFSIIGVEITDSPYVVCSMHIITRVGQPVLDVLGNDSFVPCIHSVGVPLESGKQDVPWPCNPEHTYIVHFPDEPAIWSFGSGYGGNALLGKKCLALRIASVMAHEEGWLAEHMLIMGITNPNGKKKYFVAAFPSSCGKTNLSMVTSTIPGWTIECIGDDIAWLKFGSDGKLYAVNPEVGFFAVAPGTSVQSNPNAICACSANTIFTNTALTPDGDVWWEGMTAEKPATVTSWRGESWTPKSGTLAAHPNARFTAPARQCPVMDPAWEDPLGVPISGILFGGRRATTVPLVYESFDWQHGTFLGASMSSEQTAAASGAVGTLRRDPMAMRSFCGYHMADYFSHWLKIGERPGATLPRIFHVNWFRKSPAGEFVWPGFRENVRVLKWVFERIEGTADARKTPIGYVPTDVALDVSNLNISKADLKELLRVDPEKWKIEIQEIKQFFELFGPKFPQPLREELTRLEMRL